MKQTLRRQIASELRKQITDGTYPPGAQLPHLIELQQQYDTSRETVRWAINELVHAGLVYTARSQGTFVRDTTAVTLAYRPNQAAQLWSAQTGESPQASTTVQAEWVRADPDVAQRLRTDPGAEVVLRVKHQFRGRQAAQITESWLPADLVTLVRERAGDDLLDLDLPPERDYYTLLRESGVEPADVTEDVFTRMPDPDEFETLQLSPGVPVLLTLRTTRDDSGRPVETSTCTAAGDRMSLSYTLPLR